MGGAFSAEGKYTGNINLSLIKLSKHINKIEGSVKTNLNVVDPIMENKAFR
jgi:hypothetical protein